MRQLHGIILAGGASKRMGQDKATLVLPGSTLSLLEQTATLLAPLVEKVWIAGRVVEGFPSFLDETPGLGPLGGIVTSLEKLYPDSCLVVSCDLPLLSEQLLQELIVHHKKYNDGFAATLCFHPSGKIEPLVGIYNADSLTYLKKQMEQSILSLRNALPSHLVLPYRCPAHLVEALFNMNSPEDLRGITSTHT